MTLDEAFVKALVEDYETPRSRPPDRVMLDYVDAADEGRDPRSTPDHDRLRAAGFDDRGILQITLIASWFNCSSAPTARIPIAGPLGVGEATGGTAG